jgi:RNA polymerase sigma factor (sigma-70 family)
MGIGRMGAVVHQFQRLYAGGSVVGMGEWELIQRYLDSGDEDAFRAIVATHGPMVMAVCRRVLGEPRDVEDAFQVTFLILAKKAAKLAQGDPIGHWLYGVAYRVALRARRTTARRHARERTLPDVPEAAFLIDDPSRFELSRVIDEELAKLPAKYRAPVVLCYLEGLTHDEAARQLDWPVGTVKGRLSRARDLLKGRLSRRGLEPSNLASLAVFLERNRELVPASIVERTAKAALEIAAGRMSGMVSASAALLLEEGIRTMFFHKLKPVVVALMVLGTGAVVVAYQGSKGAEAAKPSENPAAVAPKNAVVPKAARPKNEFAGPVAEWPILVDNSPKTLAILKKLDQPIAMKFATETPLEDIKKYIQDSTQDEAAGLPTGIPIYVDPQGLQDADKTMQSTVSIDLEGIPLRTTLRLLLSQIGLNYIVRDGLLTITSNGTDDNPSPFERLLEMDRRGELSSDLYEQLSLRLQARIELLKLMKDVQKLENENQ